MNKQKILTVSVAAYNLGSMIETNIKSFCESPVADDIELIITDDGSKDNTVELVEKYLKVYPSTIKLIKKANEGPGSTVNSGIKNASGKYFRMVDGDDWVNTKNLEKYISFLKESDSDMIISDYDVYNNETKSIIETCKYRMEAKKELLFDDIYMSVPTQMHAITYKTAIFKENNIVLDNCFYTDVEYLLLPLRFVKTVSYFNESIYVYRVAQANQSVSPTSMKKNINQHDLVLNRLLKEYNDNVLSYSKGQREYIANRLANMADVQLGTLLLFDTSEEKKEEIKSFIKRIKSSSSDIYGCFSKGKKCRLLVYSNYLLYKKLSKMYKKRF